MIKINLLKAELPKQPMTPLVEEKAGSRKIVWVLGGLVLAGAGAYLAWNSLSHSASTPAASTQVVSQVESTQPEPISETPPEPPMQTTVAPASGEAVEDIVGELARNAEAAPKPRGYVDLVPSERVEYQLQTVQQLLKDVKAITPPDVGFAEFVFTPPGEFYVHGLAYSPASLKRFEKGLQGLQGAEVKPGIARVVGSEARKVNEFSFYCKVKYPVSTMPSDDKVVQRNKVDVALREAIGMGQSLGLKLKTPKLTGREESDGLQRLVFATTTEVSYDKLTDFLEQMRTKQSPLGVLRVSLKAHGDEEMVADLDLVAYVDRSR
jgi:hypothetical protein